MLDPPSAPMAAGLGSGRRGCAAAPVHLPAELPRTKQALKHSVGQVRDIRDPFAFWGAQSIPSAPKSSTWAWPALCPYPSEWEGTEELCDTFTWWLQSRQPEPSQPKPTESPAARDPNLTVSFEGLHGTVPTHTPHGARAGATLPSTTGGVLFVGGASGVVVGGKRTLKSQNWDVGCKSSDNVSKATPAPLLPMAGSAGILRTAPSQTAFYNFYAGPAKRHPGCRGGENCKGLAMRRRRDGEGRRTDLMDKPRPVKSSPAVPWGS